MQQRESQETCKWWIEANTSTSGCALKGIKLTQVGPRPIVDLLIGADQADLLYSLEDVRGKPGEPIARLTPLGLTCIGNPEGASRENSDKLHLPSKYYTGVERSCSPLLGDRRT